MALIFSSSVFSCVGKAILFGQGLKLSTALVARTDLDAVFNVAGASNFDGLLPIISLHVEVRCSSLSQLAGSL